MANPQGPPVVLGSSLSGLLCSLALSRSGIDHVLVGGPPPADLPRLGEALNDTASPELWRLFGREHAEWFHYKSHIAYFDGDFATLIHLASPLRSAKQVAKFAPATGTPRYAWFGEALFHLDRIGFDLAIYRKALAEKCCRFASARVTRLDFDAARDRVARIALDDGSVIDDPRYVLDNTGGNSLVANAAGIGQQLLSAPQRVVFTHFRGSDEARYPPEWWRHGTNLLRLDRAFDGVDGIAWLIPIGRTLSVGLSVDEGAPNADEDRQALMDRLVLAYQRRGLDPRPIFPEQRPIQELRHTYFVRERGHGPNWILVGGSYITAWFPGSTGLWTTTAVTGMVPRLLAEPGLGAFYEREMRKLISFHHHLDTVIHGRPWRSSLQVFRFFGRGISYIWGRVATYFRIVDDDYGWFRPSDWALNFFALAGKAWPVMLLLFGFAVVHNRMETDRSRQARHFPLYFHTLPFRLWNLLRALPQLLWSAIPRPSRPRLPPPSTELGAALPRPAPETSSSAA